jgi:hypothetical protein
MTTAVIRQKLYDYIRVADDRKVKAIYTMLEGEVEEAFDFWNDKAFVDELSKRSDDYKQGTIKGVAWEEVKIQLLTSTKK